MDDRRPKLNTEYVVLSTDSIQALQSLQGALCSFFTDAETIVVSTNLYASFEVASEREPIICLMHTAGIGTDTQISVAVQGKDGRLPSAILLGKFFHQNSNSSDLAAPIVGHYHSKFGYLGTILIPRVSSIHQNDANLQVVNDRNEFFQERFVDCIKQVQFHDPYALLFRKRIVDIAQKCSLTYRECEVFAYHIFGKSYTQIGAYMDISSNTVRTHVNAIHRKTGTHGLAELFVKYFTPSGGHQDNQP